MTPEEFLLDTLEYYCQNPKRRCTAENGSLCQYDPIKLHRGDTEGCAIGRKLSKIAREKYGIQNCSIDEIFDSPELKEMAPEWMQEMNIEFLVSMQKLHDDRNNWHSEGLSPEGIRLIHFIIDRYGLSKGKFLKYIQRVK